MSHYQSNNNSEKIDIHPDVEEWVRMETRRQFLGRGMNALGFAAMSMLGGEALAQSAPKLVKQAAMAMPAFMGLSRPSSRPKPSA